MASIQDVYSHLKTLTKKWFYDKTEVDNKLSSKESTSNKTTALSSSSTNTQYPSAKAVFDALQLVDGGGGSALDVEDFYIDTSTDEIVIVTGNSNGSGGSSVDIVTQWEQTPSDLKVPSEKLVYDTFTLFAEYNMSAYISVDSFFDLTKYKVWDSTTMSLVPSNDVSINNNTIIIDENAEAMVEFLANIPSNCKISFNVSISENGGSNLVFGSSWDYDFTFNEINKIYDINIEFIDGVGRIWSDALSQETGLDMEYTNVPMTGIGSFEGIFFQIDYGFIISDVKVTTMQTKQIEDKIRDILTFFNGSGN